MSHAENTRSLKKTLFLSELYAPLSVGSANMFVYRFGLYPPDRIVVLTNVAAEQAQDFDARVQYEIRRIPLRWNGPKHFEWSGMCWSLIKTGFPLILRQKVDVIQCARPLPEGLAGYLLAKLLAKKLVINFHGEDISVFQNYRVERRVMKHVIQRAHINLANSSFTESLIKNLGGAHVKTGIVYPGFNPCLLRHLEPDKISQIRRQAGGSPILLTVGRLQQRKGQDNVIRALPHVLRHFPNTTYYIVGSTHGGTEGLPDYLRQLASDLGVSRHVVLTGEVTCQDLPYYYAASDLFIMPNRDETGGDVEGFGIVFLEASFFGKPVIGGTSGGVPDAIQHEKTGLLVNGNSVEEIADAIIRILSDTALAHKMGEQGKEFALNMTHEKIFEQYASLLSSLGL